MSTRTLVGDTPRKEERKLVAELLEQGFTVTRGGSNHLTVRKDGAFVCVLVLTKKRGSRSAANELAKLRSAGYKTAGERKKEMSTQQAERPTVTQTPSQMQLVVDINNALIELGWDGSAPRSGHVTQLAKIAMSESPGVFASTDSALMAIAKLRTGGTVSERSEFALRRGVNKVGMLKEEATQQIIDAVPEPRLVPGMNPPDAEQGARAEVKPRGRAKARRGSLTAEKILQFVKGQGGTTTRGEMARNLHHPADKIDVMLDKLEADGRLVPATAARSNGRAVALPTAAQVGEPVKVKLQPSRPKAVVKRRGSKVAQRGSRVATRVAPQAELPRDFQIIGILHEEGIPLQKALRIAARIKDVS